MPAPSPPRRHLPNVAVVSDYSLATLGGAENAFHAQVSALADHTHVLAVSPPCERLDGLQATGASILPVQGLTTVRSLGFPVVVNTARLRDRLAAAYAEHRIGVVHVHSEFGLAHAAIAAARRLGLHVVFTVHTFFWQASWRVQSALRVMTPLLHRATTRHPLTRERLADAPGDSSLRNTTLTAARAVDLVVSPSAHQAKLLRAAGAAPVTVIPNTVADNPAAVAVDRVEGPLRVLWLGRLAAEKRILPFLRSARAALDEVGADRLQVAVVGTGPQHAEAARVAAGPGITLHGRQPHAEIPAWLERCHVSVLSSVGWDNQPMTVAESIMAGRGVVYCDPRLTEGLDRAGIPAFGDDESLARRLVELAYDPEPVVAASREALACRSLFSTGSFVDRLADAYAGLGLPMPSATTYPTDPIP